MKDVFAMVSLIEMDFLEQLKMMEGYYLIKLMPCCQAKFNKLSYFLTFNLTKMQEDYSSTT